MRAAIRKVVGEAQVKKGRVKIDLPPLIENGNAVPLTVTRREPDDGRQTTSRPFTSSPRRIPQPNVISVQLGPRAGRREVLDPHPARRFADTSSPLPK